MHEQPEHLMHPATMLQRHKNSTLLRCQVILTDSCAEETWRPHTWKRSDQHPRRLLAGQGKPSLVLPVLVTCPTLHARK